LFFVVGGQEVSFWQCLKNGLIEQKPFESLPEHERLVHLFPAAGIVSKHYSTNIDTAKIFVSISGFGVQRRTHAFYVKFHRSTDIKPMLTFNPITPTKQDFFFSSKCTPLKKSQVLKLLSPSCPSLKYIDRQMTVPVSILERLITVDRSEITKGIRKVRIKNKKRR
jgi:hypothetical protein